MIGVEVFRIALQGLLANRLRSALTMLGIMIGVAAVIILVAVGNGSAAAVRQQIESLGTNSLIIMRSFGGFGGGGGGGRGGGGGGPGGGASTIGTQSRISSLTLADAQALENKQAAPDILSVSPTVSATVTATFGQATYAPSQFLGTTPSYQQARNWQMAGGRFIDQQDETQRQRVAVLGQTVVTNLFGTGGSPIGQTVKFNGASFLVIGVLAPKGSNGFQDQDDIVIAPLTAVQDSLTGASAGLASITVQAESASQTTPAAEEISTILDSRHKITNPAQADFRVLNQGALLATSSSSNHVFTVLLGAVAAISLLVGGIGVMNIMLVTVTERTREIGIRKAIGAQRIDILSQFLVESVLLSVLGGVTGVVAGLVGSRFKIVGVQPVVELYSVALAFGVAVAVGLFFGIYPANRAASLRPIEALRYE